MWTLTESSEGAVDANNMGTDLAYKEVVVNAEEITGTLLPQEGSTALGTWRKKFKIFLIKKSVM